MVPCFVVKTGFNAGSQTVEKDDRSDECYTKELEGGNCSEGPFDPNGNWAYLSAFDVHRSSFEDDQAKKDVVLIWFPDTRKENFNPN
ncbi:hypothetical protein Y032_0022g592 [Ancylostoma ceylanicum]|uniref:Uncharacterized protein n=1 Tax=Ancylostoma ceylanicum TaxID=53326 RepID=A0A016UY73_9BILA|nr:hypothetical protein Y032_0022g592 [Ancylostoma ceylanicum]